MICPVCGGVTHVYDSRMKKGNLVRRRRECLECGNRFSTEERALPQKIKKQTSGVTAEWINAYLKKGKSKKI